jgi:carbon-monoxide dehydrogenase small subunit
MRITVYVNGKEELFDVRPDEFLVETLRRHHFYSVKKGCDTTSCGVCTILLEGKPIASCSFLSVRADGKALTTVEGIAKEAAHLADLFGEVGADQCGFCNPGLALTVHAMKQELVNPTDEDVRHYLVGNLCRCTGYIAQHSAIMKYMEVQS